MSKLIDDFNGNTPHLIRCIEALLDLDASGSLVPHGVGGHARAMLSAAAVRLAAPAAAQEPVAVKALEWIGIGDADWVATGAFQGVWRIHRNPKNGLFYRVRNDFDNPGFETLNEAIASSQSDYEKKIRSALSTSQSDPAPEIATDADDDRCPVCAEPFKSDDMCSTDIELGICHAACLEGSPTVNLNTGEPMDGPIPTYRYGDVMGRKDPAQ